MKIIPLRMPSYNEMYDIHHRIMASKRLSDAHFGKSSMPHVIRMREFHWVAFWRGHLAYSVSPSIAAEKVRTAVLANITEVRIK